MRLQEVKTGHMHELPEGRRLKVGIDRDCDIQVTLGGPNENIFLYVDGDRVYVESYGNGTRTRVVNGSLHRLRPGRQVEACHGDTIELGGCYPLLISGDARKIGSASGIFRKPDLPYA